MSEYQPTSIVLAKVKGYPAWPAMVLDESLLPEHISNKKPKSKTNPPTSISSPTPQSPSKKKPSIIVPVRFFSDDTYIWINTNDLKPLTKQMIQDYFSTSSKKRKIDNLLQTAYELANDPPEMGLFIEYGSKGAPPTPPPPMEEEDETKPKSPVKKKVKKAVKPKQKQPLASQQQQKQKLPVIKPKTEPKAKAKEVKEPVIEIDPDWGLEEFNQYDKQLGNFIFDSEQEQIKKFDKLQSSLNLTNEKTIDQFKLIENNLVKYLLDFDSSTSSSSDTSSLSTNEIIKSLNDLTNIIHKLPKNILAKSKLLRVLILSIRKPNDELKNIKPTMQKILHGLSIDVRENTEEEIKKSNNADSSNNNNTESTVSQTPEIEQQVENSVVKNGGGHDDPIVID